MSSSFVPATPPVATQQDEQYYGCVPYDKTNTVVISGGAPATIEFQFRDSSGTPIDLSYWFPTESFSTEEPGQRRRRKTGNKYVLCLRFSFADNSFIAKTDVFGHVIDASFGKVQFALPEYVYNMPCIYFFYGSVRHRKESAPRHVFPGRGLLLVEWSPWMDHLEHCPQKHRTIPTLEDVRRRLDDFLGKNDLLRQYEFSADDIAHAMMRPVYIFNEEPPRLRRFQYTLATFPFYENWVQGTAAELLHIAVHHYVRNKLLSNHGGIQGDEKGRDKEYAHLAQVAREEYLRWVRRKKHDLNYSGGQGWGTIHSEYARYG